MALRPKDALRPLRFPEVFTRASIASQRWRKWMVGDARGYTVDQVLADEALSAEVVEICGHYTFNDPEVKAEIAKMYAGPRSRRAGPPPDRRERGHEIDRALRRRLQPRGYHLQGGGGPVNLNTCFSPSCPRPCKSRAGAIYVSHRPGDGQKAAEAGICPASAAFCRVLLSSRGHSDTLINVLMTSCALFAVYRNAASLSSKGNSRGRIPERSIFPLATASISIG